MRSHAVQLNQADTVFRHCVEKLPPAMATSTRTILSTLVSHVVELEGGDTLIYTGRSSSALHLVVDGAFKSVMLGEDGNQQVIHFYWPSEFMALDSLSVGRHVTDLVALEKSLVYQFPWSSIERAAAGNAAFMESVLTFISDRLVEAETDQFMLGSLQATQRLAYFLVHVPRAFIHAAGPDDVFELPMTRSDIGSYLGLRTESISRLLGWMQRQGMIRVDRRSLRILDSVRIHALLGQSPRESPLTASASTFQE